MNQPSPAPVGARRARPGPGRPDRAANRSKGQKLFRVSPHRRLKGPRRWGALPAVTSAVLLVALDARHGVGRVAAQHPAMVADGLIAARGLPLDYPVGQLDTRRVRVAVQEAAQLTWRLAARWAPDGQGRARVMAVAILAPATSTARPSYRARARRLLGRLCLRSEARRPVHPGSSRVLGGHGPSSPFSRISSGCGTQ